MITLSSADTALKTYYLDAVCDMLNTSTNPLLARIKQTTADVWGKDIRRLVRYGVNGGVGAGAENGNLPTAGGNNYAVFVSTLRNLYGTIEISDKALRASANNEGAFVNLLNEEMDGLIKSSAYNFGRMLFGDGTGTLATVSAVSGSTITVDSLRNLAEGMIVDIYDDEDELAVSGRTITKLDRANKKITVNGGSLNSTTVPADSRIVMQGSDGFELTGLGALFDNRQVLYGVSKNQYGWMNPYTNSSVGEITESKIQKAIDEVEEISGSRINFIVCSWGVKRALAEYLAQNKRIVDTLTLEGGYKALNFNGIPVIADRFCPEGTMYLLNTDDFALHQLCDLQWLEVDDGKVLKQISGKAAYSATLVKYADLICTRPCGQAMLSGITEA
ncbi:MAG: phage major capsid protein [Clostridia bacterium]|nr:phage major capsid protein [Clostridia bacterium]